MPTYDYQCKTCGKTFEWFQSMSAEKLTQCPDSICEQNEKGKGEVERKIGKGAGLIFNGSGFYLTDYNRSSGSAAASASGSASSDSSSATSAPAAASSPSSPTSKE